MIKKIITEFTVEETTMDYLQCLYYDTLTYKNIMQDIIMLKRNFAFNTEVYDKFMAESLDATKKFEFAKLTVIEEYAPNLKLGARVFVDLYFNDRTISIYEMVDEGSCSSCQHL